MAWPDISRILGEYLTKEGLPLEWAEAFDLSLRSGGCNN